MENEKQRYECDECGKETISGLHAAPPSCCGQPMVARPPHCTKPHDAETARLSDEDEPCDDATGITR